MYSSIICASRLAFVFIWSDVWVKLFSRSCQFPRVQRAEYIYSLFVLPSLRIEIWSIRLIFNRVKRQACQNSIKDACWQGWALFTVTSGCRGQRAEERGRRRGLFSRPSRSRVDKHPLSWGGYPPFFIFYTEWLAQALDCFDQVRRLHASIIGF